MALDGEDEELDDEHIPMKKVRKFTPEEMEEQGITMSKSGKFQSELLLTRHFKLDK